MNQQDSARTVLVEIAVGELIDKLTILQIKSQRIREAEKLVHVYRELESLEAARVGSVAPSDALSLLTAELKEVNEVLWQVEDDIRLCERAGDFGARFIDLARSVYRHNDRRAALKRRINELVGSPLIEEKSYSDYGQSAEGR
jgi:Family of unknown function (DUF6165)